MDVLAVLADYSAQHGDPEDFVAARAAIAELIGVTATGVFALRNAAVNESERRYIERIERAITHATGGES